MDWGYIFTASATAAVGFLGIVYCLGAMGINIQFGYTGLLNFGEAAFLAVGAYGLATMVATFGLPFWVGIATGMAGAIVLALLLGVPTLRLRADYLAIVTIAASEIVRLMFRSLTLRDTFGGTDGLQQFASQFFALNPLPENSFYKFGPIQMNERNAWVSIVGWTFVALFSILTFLLMRSPWGRVLKGIREDEDAVRSLGKNVYWYKMQSLMLGGIIGAFGGFMYALGQSAVQPDNFTTNQTFFAYTILIVGGAARVLGPLLGTLIFWFLIQFSDVTLGEAVNNHVITFMTAEQAAQVRWVLAGVVLMLLMIFRPQGILGDRKEIALDER